MVLYSGAVVAFLDFRAAANFVIIVWYAINVVVTANTKVVPLGMLRLQGTRGLVHARAGPPNPQPAVSSRCGCCRSVAGDSEGRLP